MGYRQNGKAQDFGSCIVGSSPTSPVPDTFYGGVSANPFHLPPKVYDIRPVVREQHDKECGNRRRAVKDH